MELLVLKIAVMEAWGSALFSVARFLSGDCAGHTSPLPYTIERARPSSTPDSERKSPPRVGNELPFPLDVDELEVELEEKYGPDFFRPKILNYFFRNTDLETGPMDPTDFFDQFVIELENPEDGYQWTQSAMVTTPKGLGRMMAENREDAVWEKNLLVVKRFDLSLILRSVLEDCAAFHAASNTEFESQQDLSDETSAD